MSTLSQNLNAFNNRLPYIDNMKGLCILAITLLHYENGLFPNWLNTFIGSFMISGFYITNGWLHGLHKGNSTLKIKQFFNKRIRSLGIPYLYFSFIILCFDIIFYIIGHIDVQIIYRDLYKSFVLRGIGTLWFLPVIFFGELLFVVTSKYNIQRYCIPIVLIIWVFLSSFIGCKIELLFEPPVNKLILAPLFVISNSLYAYVMITLASYLPSLLSKKDRIYYVFPFTIAIYLVLNNMRLQVEIQTITNLIWQFAVSTAIFSFFILLQHRKCLFIRFLNYWGQNSLFLMLTHYSIIMEFCVYINNYFFGKTILSDWNAIFFFIITMLFEYPLALLVNKKFRFLLGK